MSKKNRRKLKEKETFVSRNDFNVDDSKVYIIATIIMFHIVPLIFMAFGETGKAMYAMLYVAGNNLFLAINAMIYGIKKGYDFKFPLIMSVLAALSVVFYNDFQHGQVAMWCLIYIIIYTLISFLCVLGGAIVKRAFRL